MRLGKEPLARSYCWRCRTRGPVVFEIPRDAFGGSSRATARTVDGRDEARQDREVSLTSFGFVSIQLWPLGWVAGATI
jgi:hypothetical protein